ncbi:hypothetical protein ECTOBSL9_2587 [Ectothiorhodospira sp. BSL-9]|nr:hypothetical protein ECTOBSL9_2587 [Ectothiorhodospira sp. BSL-9]
MPCPLCGKSRPWLYAHVNTSDYFLCSDCRLVWLDPVRWLSVAGEREYYASHRNDPGDAGYRAFLSRLSDALWPRLSAGARGLDYGCGPGPALSRMLEEKGFPTRYYDPVFFPDQAALTQHYDFITCSETAEHFRAPGLEFERLSALLRPGGWLGVMTGFRPADAHFPRWHYRRDPTHICFYSPDTLAWIARRHGWRLEIPTQNIALFHN